MCSQTRNSCAKAFDNWSRNKNLKPQRSRGGQFAPLTPSRLLGLTILATHSKVKSYILLTELVNKLFETFTEDAPLALP